MVKAPKKSGRKKIMDFDGMMESWGVDDRAPDDIGAYVAARNEKRRVRDNRLNFAPPNKLYGYQEPKSVAKPRPRLLPSLDNGGWDFTQAAGIPHYNWKDDPIRKKFVPGMASPRKNAAGAPLPKALSAPAGGVSGRRGQSVPPVLTVPKSRPPGFLPSIHPSSNDGRKSEVVRSPRPTGREEHVERGEEDDHGGVPSQHPYRGAAAVAAQSRLPQLKQATVQAYGAPSAVRRKLTAAAAAATNASARKRASSLSPRGAPQSGRGTGRGPAVGTRSDGEDDGGEAPTMHQPAPAPQRADPIAETMAAIAHLQALLEEERVAKSDLIVTKSDLDDQLTRMKAELARCKDVISKSQKAQKGLVAAERQRNIALAASRKKDCELRDLKVMLAKTSKRLDEIRMQTALSYGGRTGITSRPVAEELEDKMILRDNSKVKDGLKSAIAVLRDEAAMLQDELARANAAASDRHQRDAIILDRIARDRKAAMDDLRTRLTTDLERELIRIRDNHAKAHRHREREIEMKAAQEAREAASQGKQLEQVVVGGITTSKSLAEVKVALATQLGIVDDLTAQLETQTKSVDSLNVEAARKRTKVQGLHNAVAVAERQRDVALDDGPSEDRASAQHDAERNTLQNRSVQLKKDEAALVDKLQGLERDLAESKSRAKAVDAQAASQRGDMEADREAAKARKAEAERRSKAAKARKKNAQAALETEDKDAEIEKLTRSIAAVKATRQQLSKQNAELLEKLDRAERLVSVSALQ